MATLVATTRSGVNRSTSTGWAVVSRWMVPSSWLTSSDYSAGWSVITIQVIPEINGLKITEKKAYLFTEYRRLLALSLIHI